MRHSAKFCVDRSNRCEAMAVFQFSKMAAEITSADAVRSANMRQHSKFHKDWSSPCRNMAIFYYSDVGRPSSWIFKS